MKCWLHIMRGIGAKIYSNVEIIWWLNRQMKKILVLRQNASIDTNHLPAKSKARISINTGIDIAILMMAMKIYQRHIEVKLKAKYHINSMLSYSCCRHHDIKLAAWCWLSCRAWRRRGRRILTTECIIKYQCRSNNRFLAYFIAQELHFMLYYIWFFVVAERARVLLPFCLQDALIVKKQSSNFRKSHRTFTRHIVSSKWRN